MATNLKSKMKKLDPKRQEKINARAAELIAEELTLRDLRVARQKTQEHMAKVLQIGQGSVCRLERRSDLLISTLRSYIECMGGRLHLVAEFPDRPPVELAGFAAMENERRKNKEGRSHLGGLTKSGENRRHSHSQR